MAIFTISSLVNYEKGINENTFCRRRTEDKEKNVALTLFVKK